MIAKIAVLMNAGQRDQVFDYLVPLELRGLIHEGSKVTVPFGHRPIHGYVLELSESSEYASNLKEIADAEPEELWLTSGQINLAKWMSEYYLVSLATVLETIVPGSFQGKYRLFYQAISSVGAVGVEQPQLRPEATQVFDYLVTKAKPISRQELAEIFGSALISALAELTSTGLVEKNYQTACNAQSAKTVKGYTITEQTPAGVTNLQNKVIAFLRQSGPVPYSEVFRFTGVSRGVLATLVKKGLVRECVIILERRPLEMQQEPLLKNLQLTSEQQQVYDKIGAQLAVGRFSAHLLHGVTGSGKTEIYKRLAARCLQLGRTVLVLVPEIALTPRIAAEFTAVFGDTVAILHSQLSAGERFDQWNRIRVGKARVVLGARSALFAPLNELGLIIVDEEHENSYKQSESPFYHGPKVAEALAKQYSAVLVLGSATPAITTFYRVGTGDYTLHTLPNRIGGSSLPTVEICDMRLELKSGNRSIFSRSLIEQVSTALDNNRQVILFLNRRGYASFVLCRACGHVIQCPNCQVSLTVHKALPRLSCHYCQHQQALPKSCPVCASPYIREFGVGTERVEREILNCFPKSKVARLDGETTSRKGSIQNILTSFANGETDIMVGTQMVAKGLDFPRVTVVGVIAADLALNMPDYSSAERTFQLISQVAGRAGRGISPGRVVVQTYNPDHYSIQAAAAHDYSGFYQQELAFRNLLNYPPFCDMVLVAISSPEESTGLQAGGLLESQLRTGLSPAAKVLPVHPAPLPKLRNRYRYQIIVKWSADQLGRQDRRTLYDCCVNLPNLQKADIRVTINVDPVSFL